jgi:hypothetical protein
MQKKYAGYFSKIDFVFYNADKIKKAVAEARADKGNKSVHGSGISDPTAAVVLNNLSPLRYVVFDGKRLESPETWLILVDLVYKHVNEIGRECLDGMYKRNETKKQTYTRINIEQSTHSRAWKEIKHIQELYAVQLGLIHVLRYNNK